MIWSKKPSHATVPLSLIVDPRKQTTYPLFDALWIESMKEYTFCTV